MLLRRRALTPGYKRYALVLLTAVYTLNLVDRGLMSLLLQPIKEDLQLSDTQLGFVTGIAFGLFYAVGGVPLARWADHGNRATVTSVAIGLWGATVMACVLVSNYSQLLIARVAAAVGEAGCKPPTYSLVGDYFPGAAERTRAMAIYWLGSSVATVLSFMIGGWLSERYGWRLTFFIMGIPGLVLALIVKLTLIEPRTLHGEGSPASANLPTMKAVLMLLWRQPSSRHLGLALVLLYGLGAGMGPWYAAFLMRSHNMSAADVGFWLGLNFTLSGIAGTLLGGYIVARWFADDERAQMRMSAVGVGVMMPAFILFLAMPNPILALIAFVPIPLAFTLFLAPTYALLQRLVPDDMRATTLAVVMLFANLIGMGIGPQVVGILSDMFMPAFGADSLRYAMASASSIALWAAYHFWRVGAVVRNDLIK